MLKGIKTALEVLSGNPLTLPEVPEAYTDAPPLNPSAVTDYNEIEFAILVAQGRVRCIEWHVIQGVEVGFDHDLMVWCASPGRFHDA